MRGSSCNITAELHSKLPPNSVVWRVLQETVKLSQFALPGTLNWPQNPHAVAVFAYSTTPKIPGEKLDIKDSLLDLAWAEVDLINSPHKVHKHIHLKDIRTDFLPPKNRIPTVGHHLSRIRSRLTYTLTEL